MKYLTEAWVKMDTESKIAILGKRNNIIVRNSAEIGITNPQDSILVSLNVVANGLEFKEVSGLRITLNKTKLSEVKTEAKLRILWKRLMAIAAQHVGEFSKCEQ